MTVEKSDSPDVCPSSIDVAAAVSGRLYEADSDLIFQHLTECGACAETVSTLPINDVVEQVLRQNVGQTGQTKLDLNFVTDVVSRIKRVASSEISSVDFRIDLRTGIEGDYSSESQLKFDFLGPPHSPDEIGRMGDYAVLRVLDSGGMGIVFLATDLKLRRPVALKVLKPQLAADSNSRKRYLREAQAAAAIRHENIVTIYQVGEVEGVPFLAMELLEGESLDARLSRESQIPIDEALQIGRQIAEGLAAAHSKGLIHRDIKPANIWLERPSGLQVQPGNEIDSDPQISSAPNVKLLDFGLARALDDIDNLTQSGMILGTPAYMAPEQASGDELNIRSDLFSLGVTLYRMTTGEMPFPGGKLMATLNALATLTPKSPISVNSRLPLEFSNLIEQLLAKDAKIRPDSAKLVVARLKEIERSICRNDKQVNSGLITQHKRSLQASNILKWLGLVSVGLAVLVFLIIVVGASKKEVEKVKGVARHQRMEVATPTIEFAESARSLPVRDSPYGSPEPGHEPFTNFEAEQLQINWARYLSVPIEIQNSIGMRFRLIPPGDFQIGITDEDIESLAAKTNDVWSLAVARTSPQARKTRLTRAIYFGVTEVTLSQFRKFVDDTKYLTSAETTGGTYVRIEEGRGIEMQGSNYQWRTPHDGEPNTNEPVTQLSIRDIKEFCRWLREKENEYYRLPTESEWEFAARAGDAPQGLLNKAKQQHGYGWLADTPRGSFPLNIPLPVAQLEANAFGLFDCIGNVDEICIVDQPRRLPDVLFEYSVRGGSYGAWTEFTTASAHRPCFSYTDPNIIRSTNGFRIVREIK